MKRTLIDALTSVLEKQELVLCVQLIICLAAVVPCDATHILNPVVAHYSVVQFHYQEDQQQVMCYMY